MATPTDDDPTMETGDVDVSHPTMETSGDFAMDTRSIPRGVVSAKFEVTRDLNGYVLENAKVNIGKLYLRQIFGGKGMNQLDVIPQEGLGKTVVNNWAIYDGHGPKAKLVANTHGMHTLAGPKWSHWFTMVFEVERFKGSTLQVMGANDEDEDNEWAIVGGTGEFAMARGIIERRVYTLKGSILTQELTIEFFCRMKKEAVIPTPPEILPAPPKITEPTKRGPWGENGSNICEMEGKSQRLESLTINYGSTVLALGFSYIDEDGRIRSTGIWGNKIETSAVFKTETIKFGPSEVVKQITGTVASGSAQAPLADLTIVTNNKTYGPIGYHGFSGTPFSYTVPEDETVVGFFAKTDTYIRGIGVYTIPN